MVEAAGAAAYLVSPPLRSDPQREAGCRLRLFYYMHGRSLGNLTLYRE